MRKQAYDLEKRLLEFSVRMIKLVELLPKNVVSHLFSFDVGSSMLDVHFSPDFVGMQPKGA
jgi:hypothetical protein